MSNTKSFYDRRVEAAAIALAGKEWGDPDIWYFWEDMRKTFPSAVEDHQESYRKKARLYIIADPLTDLLSDVRTLAKRVSENFPEGGKPAAKTKCMGDLAREILSIIGEGFTIEAEEARRGHVQRSL